MSMEVISTLHQLVAACKNIMGIEFTDKYGNIIDDNINPKQNVERQENVEIRGVGQE